MQVLYGNMSFANRNRRDAVMTEMSRQATVRGFEPVAFAGLAPGVVATDNLSCTICVMHSDTVTVETAMAEINTLLQSNQYEGSFSTQIM